MKKVLTAILVCVIVSLTAITLVGCKKDTDLYYVSLKINPEIEMIVDGSGIVEYANPVNDDGMVVLEDIDLTGKNIEVASELFVDKATELGYIDVDSDGSNVYLGVEGENEKNTIKLEKNITEKINTFFTKHGIYGKVSQESLDKYATEAQNWGVNFGQAKLILRVLDANPEMSAEEVLKLSVQERMRLIKKSNKNLVPSIKAEYKEKFNLLKSEYANMFILEEEIAELKDKLNSGELTAQEIEEINIALQEKEREYNLLNNEYKTKLEALKNECKLKTEEAKAVLKQNCDERKEQYKQKYENHKAKCKNDRKIKDKIKKWQNG